MYIRLIAAPHPEYKPAAAPTASKSAAMGKSKDVGKPKLKAKDQSVGKGKGKVGPGIFTTLSKLMNIQPNYRQN